MNSTRLGHRQFCLHHDVMQRGATVQFLTLRLAPDFSPVLLSLIFMELGTSLLYIAQKELCVNSSLNGVD